MIISNKIYDLIVVGGGVVGLAILRAATLEGYSCILVERDEHLLSQASGSNSGIACTGVDASPGTLERALIRDSISLMRIFCKEHNIPTRPCGSLVAKWPWNNNENDDDDDEHNLQSVLQESHDAGDTHASEISAEELQSLEPNISDKGLGAVHIPGEIVLDPWVYSIALAVHARENGAEILTNFHFDPEKSELHDGVWHVIEKESRGSSPELSSPRTLKGRTIVNAAGLLADDMQTKGIGKARWTAKPRRGQYRIYSTSEKTRITHPIQPIPTQRTKGIFVFSSIYDQLVVGPTALDQESKTDRSIDPKVAQELDEYAKQIVPELEPQADLVGEYVGIRPGTDKRDYQIHSYPAKRWISVAGIRSTGLTASLGIGNYVVRSLQSILEPPESSIDAIRTTGLPPIEHMVADFQANDGFVTIQNHNYKVTHPLTICGWKSFPAEGRR